jgi:hypothetical protein
MGPVFRIGTMYFDDADERKRWNEELTDSERLKILLSGRYPWFALELVILAITVIYFAYLRLTTYAVVTEDCRFI